MEWKTILALALLAVPLAYCTLEDSRQRVNAHAEVEKACIAQKGEITLGGKCTFE
jgi:hypothetical protein